jgi:hypothetical protein
MNYFCFAAFGQHSISASMASREGKALPPRCSAGMIDLSVCVFHHLHHHLHHHAIFVRLRVFKFA